MATISPEIRRWIARLQANELVCPVCEVGRLKLQKGGEVICPECPYETDIDRLSFLTWSRRYESPREPYKWPLACGYGHVGHVEVWAASPRHRHVHCIALRGDPEKPFLTCTWEINEEFGPSLRGFQNMKRTKPNPPYTSKALTLFAVAAGRGRYARGQIAKWSGLPATVIDGTLVRAFKTRCVERSAGKVRVPPSGLGTRYRITRQGLYHLQWFLDEGLISPGNHDVDEVLINARNSPPNIRWVQRRG